MLPRPHGRIAPQLSHYRDKDQVEVDAVLSRGRKIWGIEVKVSAAITSKDGQGLVRLAARISSRPLCCTTRRTFCRCATSVRWPCRCASCGSGKATSTAGGEFRRFSGREVQSRRGTEAARPARTRPLSKIAAGNFRHQSGRVLWSLIPCPRDVLVGADENEPGAVRSAARSVANGPKRYREPPGRAFEFPDRGGFGI